MDDDGPSSWKDLRTNKITLGFVGSIFAVGATLAWQASLVTSRISDLERSVQHFDTSLSAELNADLAEMQIEIDANAVGVDGLGRQRAADLERNSPHWVVDALQDTVVELERRVEDLEEFHDE